MSRSSLFIEMNTMPSRTLETDQYMGGRGGVRIYCRVLASVSNLDGEKDKIKKKKKKGGAYGEENRFLPGALIINSFKLIEVAPWCWRTMLHRFPRVQYTDASSLRIFSSACSDAWR